MTTGFCRPCLLILFAALVPALALAAEIIIIPGAGFDDPSHRAPVGGNPGDTLGEQRLNAINYAADLLAAKIRSPVPIRVHVRFTDRDEKKGLQCTSTTAVTGAAGPQASWQFPARDLPGPGVDPDALYPIALANALAGRDLLPQQDDIGAKFNASIDTDPGCLDGQRWYYGYDDQPDGDLNFVATAVHELIHGLGFISVVDLDSGEFTGGTPTSFDSHILDLSLGAWPGLTVPQRKTSITNTQWVVFDGPLTNQRGAPSLETGTSNSPKSNNQDRIRLYAPHPNEPGSSISHWSKTVSPDDLMEPVGTRNIHLRDGIGLATCVLADIGWGLTDRARCPDQITHSPENIFATPQRLDFETRTAGSAEQRTLTLRNIGDQPLFVGRISLSGMDGFSLGAANCRNARLAPDEDCVIRVRFAPLAAGREFDATLRIESSDQYTPVLSVSLLGLSAIPGAAPGMGGGGCTLHAGSHRVGPLFPLLLVCGLLGLLRSRARTAWFRRSRSRGRRPRFSLFNGGAVQAMTVSCNRDAGHWPGAS